MTLFRERTAARQSPRAWLQVVALIAGTLIVFASHFRPWEVAFLEEWPLANDWAGNGGWSFAPDYLQWTLSRPLHLLPSLLGLALTNGAPGGIFAVLAVVAALQVPAVVWALRPISRSFWISGAVAMFLALHPLWPGGFLQRFLPAQTAMLALAIALGFFVRWLTSGRVSQLVSACVTLLLGFAVYPGPAAVAPLMALVLAIAIRSTRRRRVTAVAAALATTGLMTLYSLVITRLISPSGTTYELGNIEQASVGSVNELIRYVGSTLLAHGQLVIAGIVAVATLGAVLALTGAVPHWAGWLMTGTAVVSPATTVVYFGHTGWLSDIDRLGYVISMALFVALSVWPLTRTGHRIRVESVIAAAVVVVSLAGAAQGIQQWQPYIETQHRLLNALGPAVREAKGDEVVLVVDRSGTFGLSNSFPLQYIASASAVWNHDDTLVVLCFEEPAQVPSGGTVCTPDVTGENPRLVATLPQGSGTVDIYIGRQEPK